MEFERNESTMKKAVKLYKYDKHKKLIEGSIIVVIILLIFFFISKLILPAKLISAEDVTKIGTSYEFDYLRTFTVYDMSYSPSEQTLEIVMEFSNENYDGIDDYYYALSLTGASSKGTEIRELLHDTMITVIQISGVKPFDECQLLFAPQYGSLSEATDAQTGAITINKYNLKIVDKLDSSKSKESYLIDRMEIIIDGLKKQLDAEKDNLHNLQNQMQNLEKENIELEENKVFLTSDELSAVDDKITKNKETINKTNESIRQNEQKVEDLKKKLSEAISKKEELLKL